MRHVKSNEYGTEVVLTVENGMQLRADAENPHETSYVRVCDPQGNEVAYWVSDEWHDDPGVVMGAIIGALCAIEQGNSELGGQGVPFDYLND